MAGYAIDDKIMVRFLKPDLCTKRLGNRCDVIVGINMTVIVGIGITSLPVIAQSFGSQDCFLVIKLGKNYLIIGIRQGKHL